MDTKSPTGKNFEQSRELHGDKTQLEMAKLWEDDMSERTISRALKQIGFTRKKRLRSNSAANFDLLLDVQRQEDSGCPRQALVNQRLYFSNQSLASKLAQQFLSLYCQVKW